MTNKLLYGNAIDKLSQDGRSGSTNLGLGVVLSQIIVKEIEDDPKIS
ncbi:hypothetical protein [Microcoleus anatoxicus]